MRLFLTYLWVGGAVLYTLNTLAYTYLGEPARETSISERSAAPDKAPRRIASWGSHLAADRDDSLMPSEASKVASLPRSQGPVLSLPSPRDLEPATEKTVAAINDVGPDTSVRDTVEDENKYSSPNGTPNPENSGSRLDRPVNSNDLADADGRPDDLTTKNVHQPPPSEYKATSLTKGRKRALAVSPLGNARKELPKPKRRLYAPVAEATYPPSELRSSKRAERRANGAGLGLFRFGPQGF